MFTNYIKTAWRNLVRNKIYSAINIVGLATGLAVCMLIILYVEHEHSYDHFHKNADKIFWVQGKMRIGNDSILMPYMSYATAALAKQSDPAVDSYTRFMYDFKKPVIQNIQSASVKFVDEKFYFADANFFSFFSFPLVSGNKQQVLKNPFTVVCIANGSQKVFLEMKTRLVKLSSIIMLTILL